MSNGKPYSVRKGGTLFSVILAILLTIALFPATSLFAFADDGNNGNPDGNNGNPDGNNGNPNGNQGNGHAYGNKPPGDTRTDEEAAYDDFVDYIEDVLPGVKIDAGDIIVLDADTTSLQLGLNEEGVAALEELLIILEAYNIPAPPQCPWFSSVDLPTVFGLTPAGLLTIEEDAFTRTEADGDNETRPYEFSVAATTGVLELDIVLEKELGITELAITTLSIDVFLDPFVTPPDPDDKTGDVKPPAPPTNPPTINPPTNNGSTTINNPGEIGDPQVNPPETIEIVDPTIPTSPPLLPSDEKQTVLLPYDFVDPAVVRMNTQMVVFLAVAFFVIIYLMLFSRRLIARRMAANSARRVGRIE
ncbi:MAG: hypothetical protein FWD43_03805 [Coriobacteriia bacterium]|nr:hypothetical protein [Coriobacteriia bacterium]